MEAKGETNVAVEKFEGIERLYREVMDLDEKIVESQAKRRELGKNLEDMLRDHHNYTTDIANVATGEERGRDRIVGDEEEVEDAGR